MKIVLSNLPKGTEKSDIEGFMKNYADVESIEIHGDDDSNNLESLVELDERDRVVVDKVVEKLNGISWKGSKIGARVLVFQDGDVK